MLSSHISRFQGVLVERTGVSWEFYETFKTFQEVSVDFGNFHWTLVQLRGNLCGHSHIVRMSEERIAGNQ